MLVCWWFGWIPLDLGGRTHPVRNQGFRRPWSLFDQSLHRIGSRGLDGELALAVVNMACPKGNETIVALRNVERTRAERERGSVAVGENAP